MPGFQSTRLATEGALEPFFFLYTDDSIQGNPETCKQSSIMLNYEVKNNYQNRTIGALNILLISVSLKGKSTLMIYDRHPELQNKWDKAFWARGYYVSTIGNITEDAIKKYIREQAEESRKEDSRSTAL